MRIRLAVPVAAVALFAAVGIVIGTSPAGAVVCSFGQLTDSTAPVENNEPSISDDGTRVTWISEGEYGDSGDNGDANVEVWLMDLTDADPLAGATQVSNTTAGSASQPTISGDGTTIAYRHDGDPAPPGNADGTPEIWLYDIDGAGTTQVTDTSGPDTVSPTLNDSASVLFFASNRNIAGLNPDGNKEIFRYDVGSAGTTALTSETTGDSEPVVAASDSTPVVAYASTGDVSSFGDNSDGNSEIFRQGGGTSPVTDTTAGNSFSPVIDDAGTVVAFTSTSDLTGGNGDGTTEAFVHTDGVGLVQITTSTGDGETDVESLSDPGSRIAIGSDLDLVAGTAGTGSADIFLNDRSVFPDTAGHPGTFAVTHTDGSGGFADGGALAGDGTTIAFRSNADLTGENPDGNIEVFAGTCGAVVAAYTDVAGTSAFFDQVQWMSATGIASGFPNGTFKPQDPVKRQQMANFLYNLAGRPPFTPPATPTFTDVPATNVFYDQIEWMNATGIASGFPNGTFDPQGVVKRQQMANFLYNFSGQPGLTPPVTSTFSDVPATNVFYGQIEWMAAEGIASGFPNGTFDPQGPVKRQQMANFLYNQLTLLGGFSD